MSESKYIIYSKDKNQDGEIEVEGFSDDINSAEEYVKNIIKKFIIKYEGYNKLEKCFVSKDAILEDDCFADGYYIKNFENKFILVQKQTEIIDNGGWFIKSNVKICKLTEIKQYTVKSFQRKLLENNKQSLMIDLQKSVINSSFAYNRSEHLLQKLLPYTEKEINIPQEVYEKVKVEVNNQGINRITPLEIKKILKKLDLRKYYEYTNLIIAYLQEKPVTKLDANSEKKIKVMFELIQEPFAEYVKLNNGSRMNFLNYDYIMHKFCELLELNDIIDYFPLLKNQIKLETNDAVWRFICDRLGWKFTPSF